MSPYDLLIIGGGVNGAGIARDAAGRGLSVALLEAGDLGGATSSASTKLLHGGLRYLEFGDFALVRKALIERELLLGLMPHLSGPQAFVLPVLPGARSRLLLRLGLFIYDFLGESFEMPRSSRIDFDTEPPATPLLPQIRNAYRFWDGWVDDTRLVIVNARDAADRGADIRSRCAVTAARYDNEMWRVETEHGEVLTAKKLVNCAGPWAERVANDVMGVADMPPLRLVRGAHIVTRTIARGREALLLQQPDGRIVFVIPYQRNFTLIGTTDTPVDHPEDTGISLEERDYLIAAVNRSLARPIAAGDIVHSFGGVRPLVLQKGKNARETSRDWKLVRHKGVPAISVIGGKITTYRRLAEAVMARIAPRTKGWTAHAPLPGGVIPRDREESVTHAYDRWLRGFIGSNPDYDPKILTRLARLYGTGAQDLLVEGLGAQIGGLFENELRHLVDREWAQTVDDILWRRTKLGLITDAASRAAITRWLDEYRADKPKTGN